MPKYKGNYKRKWTRNKKVPKKIRKYVQKTMHSDVENKVLGIPSTNITPVSAAIQQVTLSGIPSGTGVTDRIGNKVTWMEYDIRILAIPNVTVLTPARMRVILAWNRQTNGALLPAASLLQNPAGGANITSPYNYINRSRYKVLYDKVHLLQYAGDIAESRQAIMFKIKKKFKAKPSTEYQGTSNTVADIVKNSLELFIMTDVATNGPLVNYQARLLYEDA